MAVMLFKIIELLGLMTEVELSLCWWLWTPVCLPFPPMLVAGPVSTFNPVLKWTASLPTFHHSEAAASIFILGLPRAAMLSYKTIKATYYEGKKSSLTEEDLLIGKEETIPTANKPNPPLTYLGLNIIYWTLIGATFTSTILIGTVICC